MLSGLTVLICGAGPSLADEFDRTLGDCIPDEIWACNSALTWLHTTDREVTHAVAVAGEDGLVNDWKTFPNVVYYVGSGVSPLVIRMLAKRHRRMMFFHNLLGVFPTPEEEITWYGANYPSAIVVQSGGFNVTNRAVALAFRMSAAQVVVVGADCQVKLSADAMPVCGPEMGDSEADQAHWAWVKRQTMYVDGRDPFTAFGQTPLLEGTIAGRRFVSRPDMLLSAQSLVELKRRYGDRLELVGDTLPNWLLSLPEEDWKPYMPHTEPGGTMVNIGRKTT